MRLGLKTKLWSCADHAPKNGIDWTVQHEDTPAWTRLVRAVPRIDRIEGRAIHLSRPSDDGTQVIRDCDCLLFATGYLYDFPFISPADQPFSLCPLTRPASHDSTAGFRVHGLDGAFGMFYYTDPSVAFLGLHFNVIPGPLCEAQARCAVARWTGRATFALQPPGDATESRSVHCLPPPGEYDLHDQVRISKLSLGAA